MSSSSLYQFLDRLIIQLGYSGAQKKKKGQKGKKDPFRDWANYEQHIFKTSAGRIITQTNKQLAELGVTVSSEQKELIKQAANIAFIDISKKVNASVKRHDRAYYDGKKDTQTIFSPNALTAVYRKATGGSKSDIFAKVKRTYDPAIPEYYAKIKTILNNHENLPESSGQFLHAGHAKRDGVLESAAKDVAQDIFFDIADPKLADFVEGSKTQVMAKLKVLMGKNADVMHITLEAQKFNKDDAKAKKLAFIAAADIAMDKITKGVGFAGFAGSDTPLERKRKQTIKNVTDPFKKIKGAKVKTEDIKFKVSKGKASVNLMRTVTTGVIRPKYRSTTTGRYVPEKDALESYLKIKNLINAILPGLVAGNMGEPALVHRTGRFAEGGAHPRILNVLPTKGIPVATYTYQKYPYQTFEPGFKQGSPDRDPRKLIEKSIDEAAVQLALGRFNLRRV